MSAARRPAAGPQRWTVTAIVPVLVAAFVILYLFPRRTESLWARTVRPTLTAMTIPEPGDLVPRWLR